MKVLVTGASGFLGGYLLAELRRRDHLVIAPSSCDCNLREPGALFASVRDPIDRIYHLAAWTQAGSFCDRRRGEQWIINEQINANVLAYWHAAQPQAKLIAFGTSAAYAPGWETREGNYFAAEPSDSYYAYAQAKRSLAVGLQSLARQFQYRFVYLVPSTLYGPGYRLDGRELHFIYDLIRKILDGKQSGAPVSLFGDGEQTRELVHARDAACWACDLAERDGAGNEIINLGAGAASTIREFAGMICAVVGYPPGQIRYDPTRSVGVRHKLLSVEKLNRLLPERAATPLARGLAETIAWMRQPAGI